MRLVGAGLALARLPRAAYGAVTSFPVCRWVGGKGAERHGRRESSVEAVVTSDFLSRG